ncbi:hypothetical protein QA640_05655 [Bradyrhizobium sp. CB82]|uniref:hypothetical protein n=1 Tax=Bradyrhizobium sp. CB82 TaxID=3039159 RepID=UPI0024B1354F|nr:hypothetical protein [Bradyrhizobium sp. CB82]WFU41981.1 hypothetical protein QA640_05655 [Bradyrhizobium sp. CB82]
MDVDRKQTGAVLSIILPVLSDLSRSPIMLAIGFGQSAMMISSQSHRDSVRSRA